ncbi:DeoR family transcriptional regulator [Streptomyces albofaciens JCM 4342]|uniref:LacI family DNA-binding transcriptional regulator n=1 Tax=Streptomyces albofaciens TaxID=66866 RepID=UPI001239FA31|nr:substrate-binding domain-containing protein [Streptomyces albofaciens]KAA6221209.1 DeoR family transcriptional regulator [Streptomyces albofaciens JCM 4342]
MRERAVQRHDRLLALVRQRGSARVTDLAEQLGVSPVTVRRDVEALAGKGLLDRVHGAVSWPRQRGVGGRAPVGEGRVLGLLAPSATYYFADVIRGAHEAAARAGARLVLRISDYRPEEDPARAEGLLAAGAEGLLVAPGWRGPGDPAEYGGWVAELPVPVVLLERGVPPGGPLAGLDRVCSDHGHGVLLALRHLRGQGHGAPLLVARADSPTALAVREGYAAALHALGVPAPRPVIESVPAETDPEGFERAVRELHTAVVSGEATAALVHNDVDAIQMAQRLAELGVRVPDDLALVAYDDEVAALADTPLTAVAPPKREVGRQAARLLVERLRERGGGASGGVHGAEAGAGVGALAGAGAGAGHESAADHGAGGTADLGEPAPRRHLALLPALRIRASCGASRAAGTVADDRSR